MTSQPPAAATTGTRFALTRDQWTVLLFAQIWLFLLLRGWALFLDPGTFWHVVTGERILSSGLPRVDWLSFTRAGAPWIAHQWLAELGMSLLHRMGGLDALLVVFSGALALLFAWLFRRLVSSGIGPAWALLATLLAFAASQHHFHARPHVVSLGLFAWMFGRLVDFEAGRLGPRRMLAIVPAFLVWVNVHGAAVGGLATLALVVMGWIGAWLLGRPSPVRTSRGVAFVVALVAACFATMLANPYGLALPRTWSTIVGSRELARLMQEHQPFWVTRNWLGTGLIGIFVVAFLAARWRSLQVTSFASLAWLALAVERTRHLPFFALSAVLVLPDLLGSSGWTALAGRAGVLRDADGTATRVLRGLVLGPVAALLGVVVVHAAAPPSRAEPRIVTLQPARWPSELLPAIAHATDGWPPGAAILNDMPFGGFLAYFTPRLRIAIDDRWELYGDDFMVGYVEDTPAWLGRWVTPHDPRLALVQPHSRLDVILGADGAWQPVARCPAAVLYQRRGGAATVSPAAPPTRAQASPR